VTRLLHYPNEATWELAYRAVAVAWSFLLGLVSNLKALRDGSKDRRGIEKASNSCRLSCIHGANAQGSQGSGRH
jgi:hypothetical protein